jgi:hypothetical protein
MKDPYQVLQQKEMELVRIRREVDSLRIAAPLLSEDAQHDVGQARESLEDKGSQAEADPPATGTDGLFSYPALSHSKSGIC